MAKLEAGSASSETPYESAKAALVSVFKKALAAEYELAKGNDQRMKALVTAVQTMQIKDLSIALTTGSFNYIWYGVSWFSTRTRETVPLDGLSAAHVAFHNSIKSRPDELDANKRAYGEVLAAIKSTFVAAGAQAPSATAETQTPAQREGAERATNASTEIRDSHEAKVEATFGTKIARLLSRVALSVAIALLLGSPVLYTVLLSATLGHLVNRFIRYSTEHWKNQWLAFGAATVLTAILSVALGGFASDAMHSYLPSWDAAVRSTWSDLGNWVHNYLPWGGSHVATSTSGAEAASTTAPVDVPDSPEEVQKFFADNSVTKHLVSAPDAATARQIFEHGGIFNVGGSSYQIVEVKGGFELHLLGTHPVEGAPTWFRSVGSSAGHWGTNNIDGIGPAAPGTNPPGFGEPIQTTPEATAPAPTTPPAETVPPLPVIPEETVQMPVPPHVHTPSGAESAGGAPTHPPVPAHPDVQPPTEGPAVQDKMLPETVAQTTIGHGDGLTQSILNLKAHWPAGVPMPEWLQNIHNAQDAGQWAQDNHFFTPGEVQDSVIMQDGDVLGVDKYGQLAIQHPDGSVDVLTDGQGTATPDALAGRHFSDTGEYKNFPASTSIVETPTPIPTPASPEVQVPTDGPAVQDATPTPDVLPDQDLFNRWAQAFYEAGNASPNYLSYENLRHLLDTLMGSSGLGGVIDGSGITNLQEAASVLGNPTVEDVLNLQSDGVLTPDMNPDTFDMWDDMHKFMLEANAKGLLPPAHSGERILDYLVRIGLNY